MKTPTGGWPFVVMVCVALAVTVLTFALLHRTTYKPGRDQMAPPSTRHTHKLLHHIEQSPSGLGVNIREMV